MTTSSTGVERLKGCMEHHGKVIYMLNNLVHHSLVKDLEAFKLHIAKPVSCAMVHVEVIMI